MNTNTALSAASDANTHTITFRNEKHKNFYLEHLLKCRCKDVYHKALVYYKAGIQVAYGGAFPQPGKGNQGSKRKRFLVPKWIKYSYLCSLEMCIEKAR